VASKVWDKWSAYLFKSGWMGEYMVDMIQRQLGVDVKTWKPDNDDVDVPPTSNEIQDDEFELGRYETILRVSAMGTPVVAEQEATARGLYQWVSEFYTKVTGDSSRESQAQQEYNCLHVRMEGRQMRAG